MSDDLYNFAEQMKIAIVKEADGEDGDIHNIQNKEDLEAAEQIMLSPINGQGKKLQKMIEDFRYKAKAMLNDERLQKIIDDNLSTNVSKKAKALGNSAHPFFKHQPQGYSCQ